MLSLTEALAALPGTADDIAAHLAALGRKGVREDGCNCPITNYLTGLGFDRVDVDDIRIRARPDSGAHRVRVETPESVADFVHRFDEGAWPELVVDDA